MSKGSTDFFPPRGAVVRIPGGAPTLLELGSPVLSFFFPLAWDRHLLSWVVATATVVSWLPQCWGRGRCDHGVVAAATVGSWPPQASYKASAALTIAAPVLWSPAPTASLCIGWVQLMTYLLQENLLTFLFQKGYLIPWSIGMFKRLFKSIFKISSKLFFWPDSLESLESLELPSDLLYDSGLWAKWPCHPFPMQRH